MAAYFVYFEPGAFDNEHYHSGCTVTPDNGVEDLKITHKQCFLMSIFVFLELLTFALVIGATLVGLNDVMAPNAVNVVIFVISVVIIILLVLQVNAFRHSVAMKSENIVKISLGDPPNDQNDRQSDDIEILVPQKSDPEEIYGKYEEDGEMDVKVEHDQSCPFFCKKWKVCPKNCPKKWSTFRKHTQCFNPGLCECLLDFVGKILCLSICLPSQLLLGTGGGVRGTLDEKGLPGKNDTR